MEYSRAYSSWKFGINRKLKQTMRLSVSKKKLQQKEWSHWRGTERKRGQYIIYYAVQCQNG